MALLKDTTEDYFFPGDWRREVKAWIKNNCPDDYQSRYIRMQAAKFRLMVDIGMELARRYKGVMSSSEVEKEIEYCGKHGECQENKEIDERRFVGFYCNNRTRCLVCSIRYRNVQSIELRELFMEIAQANNLWGFYSWTFTLSEQIRLWIDRSPGQAKKFLSDVRRAVAKTIKGCLGINTKTRGIQPGFSILYHSVSSQNPFKQSAHFHSLILPLLANLKKGITTPFNKRFDHTKVKRIYKKYLDAVLKKYGLDRFIRERYVVHLRDIEIENSSSVHHAFKYNNRSQVLDVLKTIKKVSDDFKSFVCLLNDKQEGVVIPHIKSRDEIVNTFDYVLHPIIQIRMSYGFMRVLDKYSGLLKIKEVDDYDDAENWEHLYYIKIMRVQKHIYDEKKRKIVPVLVIYIRGPDDDDWKQIGSDKLKGEWSAKGKSKVYKAIG